MEYMLIIATDRDMREPKPSEPGFEEFVAAWRRVLASARTHACSLSCDLPGRHLQTANRNAQDYCICLTVRDKGQNKTSRWRQ